MVPKYKLTYFDILGLGEQIRFILSYGRLEFEDFRFPRSEWDLLKGKIAPPLGQLPLLEVDGLVLYQSGAIMKYLGDLVGLSGSTPLENWHINAVYETFADLKNKWVGYAFEAPGPKKQQLLEDLVTVQAPIYLGKLDELAVKNGGKNLALGKLTWVDLTVASLLEVMDEFLMPELHKSLLTKYPNLQAVQTNVFNTPGIKEWIAKRPSKPA